MGAGRRDRRGPAPAPRLGGGVDLLGSMMGGGGVFVKGSLLGLALGARLAGGSAAACCGEGAALSGRHGGLTGFAAGCCELAPSFAQRFG